jgi:hypothetical protein
LCKLLLARTQCHHPCSLVVPIIPAGVEGEVIIQKVLGKPFSVGYNAMSDSIVDLLEEGVIDPAKVTRNGLMNSCSIAGIMLTTQVRWVGGHWGFGRLFRYCY